jgi:hypothetical protein
LPSCRSYCASNVAFGLSHSKQKKSPTPRWGWRKASMNDAAIDDFNFVVVTSLLDVAYRNAGH